MRGDEEGGVSPRPLPWVPEQAPGRRGGREGHRHFPIRSVLSLTSRFLRLSAPTPPPFVLPRAHFSLRAKLEGMGPRTPLPGRSQLCHVPHGEAAALPSS